MSDNRDESFQERKRKEEAERRKNNQGVVRSLYNVEPKKKKSIKKTTEERKMFLAKCVNLHFFGTGVATEVYAQSYFEDVLRILYPESKYEIHYLSWLNKYSLKIN